MIVTFVGSFDNKDIYAMHVTSMLDIVPFTEERIKELKLNQSIIKSGYSCKLSFNKKQ